MRQRRGGCYETRRGKKLTLQIHTVSALAAFLKMHGSRVSGVSVPRVARRPRRRYLSLVLVLKLGALLGQNKSRRYNVVYGCAEQGQ